MTVTLAQSGYFLAISKYFKMLLSRLHKKT
jgi:hypothetical protein